MLRAQEKGFVDIQVISFDVMNTILTLREPPHIVYARFARQYGFSPDESKMKAAFPIAFSSFADEFPAFGHKTIGAMEWWGKTEWKIVDEETIPILERLRLKGIHTAVISNFDFRLKKLLDDFHLSSLLELVVLSGEVGIEKPNSRIFELVTDHFHLKSPKHLLHIGEI
ncbi:unnamed protein product, partial [Mesorhabditis belari]|uniref:HAD family hydrolase n=1 Tax=Mesorhabditis belari TaxID=2138241 RepID=A0AAF3E9G9_9BILA